MSLAKQIADAVSRASAQPDLFARNLSNENSNEVVEKSSNWPKTFAKCVLSVKNGTMNLTSSSWLFSKTKKYDMNGLLSITVKRPNEFVIKIQVNDKVKEIGFRFKTATEALKWKTAMLLNAGSADVPCGAPPRGIKKRANSSQSQAATDALIHSTSSKLKDGEDNLPPNPEWLFQGCGPDVWKRRPCEERTRDHTEEVLAFASKLGQLHVSLTFERGWPWAAWGVDIVQQVLETRATEHSERRQVITPTFFVALLTINGKIKEKEKLYREVVKTFDDYQRIVVLPAIMSKSGVAQMKEFVRRWETHKIFAEYMRRIFVDLDKNTDGCRRESVSSIALRNFAKLWSLVKDRLIVSMLDQISSHRLNGEDETSCAFLSQCKEILCIMGLVDAKHVDQIKFLVSPEKANKGRFVVMSELPLLADVAASTALHVRRARTTKIVVANCLTFYRVEYENALIEMTKTYCDRIRQNGQATQSVPAYLRRFLKIFDAESNRVKAYLHASTLPRLQRCCVRYLLVGDVDGGNGATRRGFDVDMLRDHQTGLMSSLNREDEAEIGIFFQCFDIAERFGFTDGIVTSAEIFGEWIRAKGAALRRRRLKRLSALKTRAGKKYKSPMSDATYVADALSIYRKSLEFRRVQFQNKAIFQKSMNASLEDVLNTSWGRGETSTAILLVEYVHRLLGGKDAKGVRLTSQQSKATCMEVLDLFDHVFSKDLFIEHYRRKMQDRLLDLSYKEYGVESEILSKLKLRVGQVNRMEVMLKDVKRIRDVRREWIESSSSSSNVSDHASTNMLYPVVLTDTSWKFSPPPKVDMRLPVQVTKVLDAFSTFYAHKHQQRDLRCRHDLSNVVLDYRCGETTYRIGMTASQGCMLLLFNERESLTIPEISDTLRIEKDEVKRLLKSLLVRISKRSKTGIVSKVLAKDQKHLPLLDTDTFVLSKTFKHTRISFSLRKPTMKRVDTDMRPKRNVRLEAAIVRTMKANKVMLERELIREVMSQVTSFFKPDVKMIKRSVESLMERAYVQRDPDDRKKILYIS